MPHDEVIVRITELSRDRLSVLLTESEATGYRFLRRLFDEWERGVRAPNSWMAHDLKGDLCEEVTDDTLFARSPTAGPRYGPAR